VARHAAAVLTFGGLATVCAIAIVARSLDSAVSLAALVLTIDVVALLSALLARDKSTVVGFSPLDLLMRFVPNTSWRMLIGLVGALAVLFGLCFAAMPYA
jgi:hypothetical protein